MRHAIRSLLPSFLPALLGLILAAAPCHAGLVVTTTPVSATPGSTGYFDVRLTNDSAPARTLAAFSLDLQVSAGVLITSVDASTSSPYVFGADGTGTLTFDALPASTVNISDLDLSADGFVTLAAGQTVGLGRVGYQIAANAPTGPVTISFVNGPVTLLLSASGPPYPDSVLTITPGSFEVAPDTGAVPEPSSALMLLGGLGLVASVARRRMI